MKHVISAISLFIIIPFLFCSEKIQASLPATLETVARVVLFTIFPANVLFRLVAFSPAARAFSRFFSKTPVWSGTRLSPAYIPAVLAGQLSGFPTGASVLGDLEADKSSGKALALSCVISPAFLVAVLGAGAGLLLWVNFLLVLWSASFIIPSKSEQLNISNPPDITFAAALGAGVQTAIAASGAIIFFSSVMAIVPDSFPKIFRELLCALLEAGSASRFCTHPASLSLALSFGGLSALSQISFCAPNARLKWYLLSRIPLFFTCLFFVIFPKIRIFQTLLSLFFFLWQISRRNTCKSR